MGILNGIQKFLHTLRTTKDVEVGRDLDVVGNAAIGGTVTVKSNQRIGSDGIAVNGCLVPRNSSQTINAFTRHTGTDGNYILLCEYADRLFNFGHPQYPDPTDVGHSGRQSKVEYWSKTHDRSNVVNSTAFGGHTFTTQAQKARGTMTVAGIPVAEESFVINATTITFKADGSGDIDHCTIAGNAADQVTNLVATLGECTEAANLTAWDGVGDTVVYEWGTAGVAGNAIVFTEAATNITVDGAGTLGTTHAGVAAATLFTIKEDGTVALGTDGGVTNYAQFAADGELTLAGTARVTKSIDIGNANLGKGASAPTEVIIGNFVAWEYGVNDDTEFDIIIPHDIAAGTDMTLNVVWQINEAGGDEVQWQIDYESIPADSTEAIGGVGTQVKSGDVVVPGTVRFLTETAMTIAAANIAANEHCGITLTRIAIDDGVAPALEPGVVDIHIEYISDKLGEAT